MPCNHIIAASVQIEIQNGRIPPDIWAVYLSFQVLEMGSYFYSSGVLEIRQTLWRNSLDILYLEKKRGASLQISYLCSPPIHKGHSGESLMNLGSSQAESFQVETRVTEMSHRSCVKMFQAWFYLCEGPSEPWGDLAVWPDESFQA